MRAVRARYISNSRHARSLLKALVMSCLSIANQQGTAAATRTTAGLLPLARRAALAFMTWCAFSPCVAWNARGPYANAPSSDARTSESVPSPPTMHAWRHACACAGNDGCGPVIRNALCETHSLLQVWPVSVALATLKPHVEPIRHMHRRKF